MRRSAFVGGGALLAASLALLAGGGSRKPSRVAKLQAQRRALVSTAPPPLLAILSPPGAGYDSTNVALGTGSGVALTFLRASAETCEITPGALTSVASNKPCVESGALKVEPSGTNSLLQSGGARLFGSWTALIGTPAVTANTWDFGTGSATGETITDDDAASRETLRQIVTTSTTGAWTFSCYMQSGHGWPRRGWLSLVAGGTGSTVL
jgi:hypothetical protein